MENLPRQLADFDRLIGVLKADYEDFHVEEIPLYPFKGEGSHLYFLVEKRGLSTMQAARDIARALERHPRDIGLAGLKDARAVTRQWMSIEHVDASAFDAIRLPRIEIIETTRHSNKLKLGHLRGNRFLIHMRETQPQRLAELQQALATLERVGVPNYFGPQRFGNRGDGGQIGRALLLNDIDRAVSLILGAPGPLDTGDVLRARTLYEEGRYDEALKAWPRMFHDQRAALRALVNSNGQKRRALAAIDPGMRKFFISAFQSELFNNVVAARMATGIGQLMLGDLAWRHRGGAVFLVEDPVVEQPRADALEISPSGPLFGGRMTVPKGVPAEIEASVLERDGLTAVVFQSPRHKISGMRRPMRFPIEDASARLAADQRGAYLALSFTLPRGCYATSLLRELFVDPGADGWQSDGTDDPDGG